MKNIPLIKFKCLNISIIFLICINLVGCNSSKTESISSSTQQNLISVQITESTVIKFSDKNLEQTIRDEIQCPTGDILKDDVDKITKLQSTKDKHISNLSGIENLANLTSLNLSNNQIRNIKPLEGLTNLTDLNLSTNQMTNIEPLKDLTNLTNLNLATNQISNIEPLKGLTNLTDLDLATNQMTNMEVLKGLTNLKDLNLETIKIEAYSPISPYCRNLGKPDIVSSVIISKEILLSKTIIDVPVAAFSDGDLGKLIKDTTQHPSEDILKSDADNIGRLQPTYDKNNMNLSRIENSTDLELNTNKISRIAP